MQYGLLPTFVDGVAQALVKVLTGPSVSLPPQAAIIYGGRPEDLLENPKAESRFAVVWPQNLPVNQDVYAGAGPVWTQFDSTWHIHFFVKLNKDQQFSDAQFLTDSSVGMAVFLQRAITSFSDVNSTLDFGTSDSLLDQPMRLLNIRMNPRKPGVGWGWAETTWAIKFRSDFTTNG